MVSFKVNIVHINVHLVNVKLNLSQIEYIVLN